MKKLLLCFAHPDDESFSCGGTIAKYVAEGWKVEAIYATRGEAGKTGDYGERTKEQLGNIRQREMEDAAKILGLGAISFFDYEDSNMAKVRPGQLEEELFLQFVERAPDVIITHDTTGGTNHPDHVKMCFAVTYAFQKYAAWLQERLAAAITEDPSIEPKLYYTVMPESVVSYLIAAKGLQEEAHGKPVKGIADSKVTTVIDIREWEEKKREALYAHVSQKKDVDQFLRVTGQPFFAREYFLFRMHGATEIFMGKGDRVAEEL